jgi:cell fate regulator YaaT (PSP1 superfamily)
LGEEMNYSSKCNICDMTIGANTEMNLEERFTDHKHGTFHKKKVKSIAEMNERTYAILREMEDRDRTNWQERKARSWWRKFWDMEVKK